METNNVVTINPELEDEKTNEQIFDEYKTMQITIGNRIGRIVGRADLLSELYSRYHGFCDGTLTMEQANETVEYINDCLTSCMTFVNDLTYDEVINDYSDVNPYEDIIFGEPGTVTFSDWFDVFKVVSAMNVCSSFLDYWGQMLTRMNDDDKSGD